MKEIRIMGIDPSLRNTGYCQLIYDRESNEMDLKHIGILKNPISDKNKGTNAIKSMIGMMKELFEEDWTKECMSVVIESPLKAFWAGYQTGSLIGVAHISGAAAAYAGLERATLVYPAEWNKAKKKEKTQMEIQDIFGACETWEFETKVKESLYEHIIDAVGMSYWFLNSFYLNEETAKEDA